MNNPFYRLCAAVAGTILVAFCCFTPYLAALLSFLGLVLIVPYLDIILIPLLFALGVLTVFAFLRWQQSQNS